MKKCCECEKNLDFKYFSKNKNLKDGLNNRCKVCCSIRNKKRYNKNKEKLKAQTNEYYHNNKEIIKEKSRTKPNYNQLNPDYYKKYREENKEKLNDYYKEWRQKNKAAYSLRIQIWWWIKNRGVSKNEKTEKLLGYTFNEFEEKIGKPLNNQHLDHKIPLSWFEDNTPINLLFSLENLHYIDAKENQRKSNYYKHPITEDYKKQIEGYIKDKYKKKL